MKIVYRGHEIEVVREKALGGWDNLYMSVFRLDDGYELVGDFSTGSDTVKEMVGYMKERVDGEIEEGASYEPIETETGWKRPAGLREIETGDPYQPYRYEKRSTKKPVPPR